MRKPKTYKTLSGVLRSFEGQIHRAKSKEAHSDMIRQAVLHVMPQIGITADIGAGEKILDALRRLKDAPEHQTKTKDIDALIKWVIGPWVVTWERPAGGGFKAVGSTLIPGGSIKTEA